MSRDGPSTAPGHRHARMASRVCDKVWQNRLGLNETADQPFREYQQVLVKSAYRKQEVGNHEPSPARNSDCCRPDVRHADFGAGAINPISRRYAFDIAARGGVHTAAAGASLRTDEPVGATADAIHL